MQDGGAKMHPRPRHSRWSDRRRAAFAAPRCAGVSSITNDERNNMSNISCVVDAHGRLAAESDINAPNPERRPFEGECMKYEYDLATRTSVRTPSDRDPLSTQDRTAGDFFDRCAGTPDKLMAFARQGTLDRISLARLLRPEQMQTYLDACERIDKAVVEACAAKGETCLEGGCAAEGETCLEACLAAEPSYRNACAAAWSVLFENPDNRIDCWRK
jgi:hypothetical protein